MPCFSYCPFFGRTSPTASCWWSRSRGCLLRRLFDGWCLLGDVLECVGESFDGADRRFSCVVARAEGEARFFHRRTRALAGHRVGVELRVAKAERGGHAKALGV